MLATSLVTPVVVILALVQQSQFVIVCALSSLAIIWIWFQGYNTN